MKPAGTTARLVSTSASSPTMPSGYIYKRRISSFRTNSSSQIINYSQWGDDCREVGNPEEWSESQPNEEKNSAAGQPMAVVSVADAAEAAKVSRDTIAQARKVLDEATQVSVHPSGQCFFDVGRQ